MVAAGFNYISVLGDRLGLFKTLYDIGPCDSATLAKQLNLHERWVREWLQHQACVGQVTMMQTRRFAPEAHAVLVDAINGLFNGCLRCCGGGISCS